MQMRKIYEYQVVRYYPNELSDEFVNVGVMLNGTTPKERIISELEAKHLYCSVLIGENKKFYAMVEYLNQLVIDKKLRDPYQYFHNFNFSEVKVLASSASEEVIFEELFETYIGYKLQSEEKLDRRIQLIQKSYKILEDEFTNFIQIHKAKKFDFEIEHLKTQKIYHANVGSIANKQDVFKMIMETPISKAPKHQYNFLDIATISKKNDYKERFDLNNIKLYDYSSEEKIVEYYEKLIA